ncbi:DUF4352 domain-containing protein [Halomicrobium salinisoli]|uniref:DUF4352 domain-containing protein n=1 Tax=Halomicrobium salinisoli TaxID=2878391 RepID=UPI001CF0A385|nr:DUF4352 domain-containing protein [Halomicrobium salinisoli]
MQRRSYLAMLGATVPLAGLLDDSGAGTAQAQGTEDDAAGTESADETESSTETARDVTATVGELIEGDRLHLVVESVERGADLGEFSEPDAGNEFLLVNLAIKNVADEFVTVSNLLQTRVRDDEDYQYDQTFAGGEQNTFNDGQFAPGEVERGALIFETPADAGGLALTFDFDVSILGGIGRATVDLTSEASEVAQLEQELGIDVYGPGEAVEYGGVEVTVNDARVEDQLGQFATPDEGNEYVIVDVAITNDTGEQQRFSTVLQMMVKDGEGYTYQEDFAATASLDRAFDEGTPLADGETRRGELAYQVTEGRTPLYWVFEFELFNAGDKTFWELRS